MKKLNSDSLNTWLNLSTGVIRSGIFRLVKNYDHIIHQILWVWKLHNLWGIRRLNLVSWELSKTDYPHGIVSNHTVCCISYAPYEINGPSQVISHWDQRSTECQVRGLTDLNRSDFFKILLVLIRSGSSFLKFSQCWSGPRFLFFAGSGPVRSYDQDRTARSVSNRFWSVDPWMRKPRQRRRISDTVSVRCPWRINYYWRATGA